MYMFCGLLVTNIWKHDPRFPGFESHQGSKEQYDGLALGQHAEGIYTFLNYETNTVSNYNYKFS